jgi:hypothetical protein
MLVEYHDIDRVEFTVRIPTPATVKRRYRGGNQAHRRRFWNR